MVYGVFLVFMFGGIFSKGMILLSWCFFHFLFLCDFIDFLLQFCLSLRVFSVCLVLFSFLLMVSWLTCSSPFEDDQSS